MKNMLISIAISAILTGCANKEESNTGNTPETPQTNKEGGPQKQKNDQQRPQYEIYRGYSLPPEPDPILNNSTLKGIDMNDNGVRDDVERLIVKELPKEKIDLFMHTSANYQKVIESTNLESEAMLIDLDQAKSVACEFYMKEINLTVYDNSFKDEKAVENKIFNTKERMIQRAKYNRALSGSVLEIPWEYSTKEYCLKVGVDTEKLLREKK